MDRKGFIGLLGVAAGLGVIVSCSKEAEEDDTSSNNGSSNVNFTIDLNDSKYAALKTLGTAVKEQGVIIVHTTSNSYIALSDRCTHTGCAVNINGSLPCPCHGSKFDLDGNVINGPANSPLSRYKTELNGSKLRVFS